MSFLLYYCNPVRWDKYIICALQYYETMHNMYAHTAVVVYQGAYYSQPFFCCSLACSRMATADKSITNPSIMHLFLLYLCCCFKLLCSVGFHNIILILTPFFFSRLEMSPLPATPSPASDKRKNNEYELKKYVLAHFQVIPIFGKCFILFVLVTNLP